MFAPLLSELKGFDAQIIALPDKGDQDYERLSDHVIARLPKQAFILLAESFSGPIAARIVAKAPPNLKGVVFVATFLSAPNRALLSIARLLPLSFLVNLVGQLPFARFVYRVLFLGPKASDDLTALFHKTVKSLSGTVMKARLAAIQSQTFEKQSSAVKVIYIQASSDKLVPRSKSLEFKSCYENLVIKVIEGPHFLLQAKPVESAEIIADFASGL